MRLLPRSALIAALFFIAPATLAQQQGESAGDALAKDPEVVESQGPMPDETGTRAPEAQQTETAPSPLIQAMRAVSQAPPDLQGNPVKRPNDLASEPVAHSR